MVWRALLRVVDFEALLTAQSQIAEALAEARRLHGADSGDARTLEEGYNLVAKVLWSRRASIRNVHDLAWLDHAVAARGLRPGKGYEGEAARSSWEALASRVGGGALPSLLPGPGSSTWVDVDVEAFGGPGTVKLERGREGAYIAGVATMKEWRRLAVLASQLRAIPIAEIDPALGDIEDLVAFAIEHCEPSAALVFVASSPPAAEALGREQT